MIRRGWSGLPHGGAISRVGIGIFLILELCLPGLMLQRVVRAGSLIEPEGRTVRSVSFKADGPLYHLDAVELPKLVLLKKGIAFSASLGKASIDRLYATGLFHDIQIEVEEVPPDGVDVTFLLIRTFRVREIRFDGDVALDRTLLQQNLKIREGDPFSEQQFTATISDLKDLYRAQGYYQAQIEPDYRLDQERGQVDIILKVRAGKQATVGDLELDTQEHVDLEEIRSLLKTGRGEKFSMAQVDADIQTLKDYFALRGYLNPDIYLRQGPLYDPARNSVRLVLRIVPRQHTPIEFVGLDPGKEEIADLPLFREQNTAQIFLKESQQQLLERFQKKGYFLAQVRIEAAGASENSGIRIEVDRKEKCKLQGIRFEGNQYLDDETLGKLVNVKKAGFLGRGTFTSKMAEDDVDRIINYYQQIGFLDVEATYSIRRESSSSSRLLLTYTIQEGPHYVLDTVQLVGNDHLTSDELQREIGAQPRGFYSPVQVAQDRANLIAAYENRGYRNVDVRIQVSFPEAGHVGLLFQIEEGARLFAGQVILTGNHDTHNSVVRKEVEIKPGEPLALDKVLKTETNLYNLAVFNRVEVNDVPSYQQDDRHMVIVNMDEAKKYTLLYGIGYSSFEGARGTLGITNNNFLGKARALSLGLRAGAQRQRGSLSYSLPRLFDRRLPTIVSLTADNQLKQTGRERGTRIVRGRPFDEFRLIASSQTERTLSRRESLFFRYNFEDVRIKVPENLAVPLQFFREEEVLRLSTVSLSYLNDSRDDPTNPTSGFFLSGEVLLSSSWIGSDKQFIRDLTQGQYYRKLLPNLVFASSLRIGIIAPFGKTAEEPVSNPIPISERFFSGGATSLRGIPQDLAGPLLRDQESGEIVLVNEFGEPDPNGRPVPLGGNALLISNLELRFPIFGFVSGAVFYDVGNVARSITNFSSAGVSNSIGFGLAVKTPVGPIRFDAGYNPNPPEVPGFKHWIFHLNLGNPF